MTKHVVQMSGVRVDFPSRSRSSRRVLHAVAGVSLEIRRGETFGLVGESGSGKSTLGRAAIGLQRTVAGSIRIGGREISGLGHREMRAIRPDMQMIFQDPYSSLNRRMTVREIIRRPLTIQGAARQQSEARVNELLDVVGLPHAMGERYPVELSGGQRQRVGIARAIATKPKFVVCDEPISALDVSIQAQIVDLLMRIQSELGVSYLLIAHDLAAVRDVSHRVGVMYLGALVEVGSSSAVFARPLHPYSKALISAAPIPDPIAQRQRQRIVLSGELPSPLDVSPGCPFASRCPHRQERCNNDRPALVRAGADHAVACHFWREIEEGTA